MGVSLMAVYVHGISGVEEKTGLAGCWEKGDRVSIDYNLINIDLYVELRVS